MNIAAAAQDRLEEIALHQIREAQVEADLDKICIAGGVGLNCSLNGKILSTGLFREIFVQPAAGDNGTAIGACYLTEKQNNPGLRPKKHHNFYLGTRQTDAEIESFLKDSGLKYAKLSGNYAFFFAN